MIYVMTFMIVFMSISAPLFKKCRKVHQIYNVSSLFPSNVKVNYVARKSAYCLMLSHNISDYKLAERQ